ncbi:RELT-like protein 1 isoform X1 [Zootoca vivipara]|uniref:RELT-like protein 1 isoform X1 n=1 Tax=Zootoca vivipara TaxID=8524 RepID=UPI00293B8973|nr:RELT-like protein 1 isoform X1 [Zootoca vivipara]
MAPQGPAATPAYPAAFFQATSAQAGNRSAPGSPRTLASHSAGDVANKPESGSSGNGQHPEYIAYFLIPVFFLMGLLGVFICHMLKKKGYRCTTESEQEEEELGEKIELNESTNDNGDTVGKIVDYIMKNEANADVLKAMVADNSVYDPESPTSPTTPGSPTSPVSPSSSGGPQLKHTCRGRHLHTVGGVAGPGDCSRCNQKRWHLFSPAKKSKEAKRARHGEVTVLSVGRFRVTKVEHKSASKERKNLMSVSGVESVNGEVPATPVKEASKEAPVTPAVKQVPDERQCTRAKQEDRARSGSA